MNKNEETVTISKTLLSDLLTSKQEQYNCALKFALEHIDDWYKEAKK